MTVEGESIRFTRNTMRTAVHESAGTRNRTGGAMNISLKGTETLDQRGRPFVAKPTVFADAADIAQIFCECSRRPAQSTRTKMKMQIRESYVQE
jgi:hypothetical protein